MFFSATLLALPLLAQSVLAGNWCTRKYTVKEGDICDSISAAQNVSTYQLSTVNAGLIDASCSNLIPGQELCLGNAGEDCSTTYVIVADDTCEQIASNLRVNTTILYLNNPQINNECSNLYVGEVLCASDKVQAPPVPSGSLPGATIPPTAIPAKPTTASTPGKTKPTVAPAVPTPAPAAPTPAPVGDDDNDNDDDLPYCDEL